MGMDALVTVCSWNTNGIMVWAWMLRSTYGTRALLGFWAWTLRSTYGTRTLFGFALGSVYSWNTNVIMLGAWMLWATYALGTRTILWIGHGCSCCECAGSAINGSKTQKSRENTTAIHGPCSFYYLGFRVKGKGLGLVLGFKFKV